MPTRTHTPVPSVTPRTPHHNLLPYRHDPVTLQQLRRTRPPLRIPLEAPPQKLDPLRAQLLLARQLRRIALGDVVHDSPLIVQARPRPTTGAHFEDDAAQGPDVDGAVAAFVEALDHFGGHVHGRAGHRLLFSGHAAGAGVLGLERFTLAGDDFGGAEIDEFDDTVVVEEDVYRVGVSVRELDGGGRRGDQESGGAYFRA